MKSLVHSRYYRLNYLVLTSLFLLFSYDYAHATSLGINKSSQLQSIIEDGVVKTIQYDQAGNMIIDDQGNQLNYDSDNELIKVTQTNGSVIQYDYDALNQQMRESFNQSEPLYHFYQNQRILDDLQLNSITHYFEHGQLSITTNQIKTAYYLQNNFGSVITLMDKSQQLTHFYRYLPFGYQSDMKPDSLIFDVFDLSDSDKGYNWGGENRAKISHLIGSHFKTFILQIKCIYPPSLQ